tara:strand:+ start:378734 stop:379300 length:567 start_codon:yes stop_codon:yes gene_type:complete
MKTLLYATGNPGKVDSLQSVLGSEFHIDQIELDLIEPQLDSVDEIARDKARQAFSQTKKPVAVQDSGFVIPSLGGFPGPYTKYVLGTIGVERILRLVGEERYCFFHECLAYADETGVHLFQTHIPGSLTRTVQGPAKERESSALWRVFVPTGQRKTISEMSDSERVHWRQSGSTDHYGVQLARWLSEE